MKKILFISTLDFSRLGNQTLLSTILGYVKNGFKVILLTSSPKVDGELTKEIDLPAKYREKIIIKRFCPLFRKPRKLFIKIRKKIRKVFDLNNQKKVETPSSFFTYRPNLSFISFFFGGFLKGLYLTIKHRPNLIYGYEPCGIFPAWLIAKIFSIKIITRFQGTILYPELEKDYFNAFLRFPFHILAMKLPVDLVVMGNDGTRGKDVLLKLGVPKRKIKFWINGINKNIYFPNITSEVFKKETGLNSDIKIILTISRLERWKRVDRAIKAMSIIYKKIPNAKLVVVGWGKEKVNLQKLARKLKIQDRVIFTGGISHNKVKYYLNRCNIFLSLYDFSNLCNPVLEALECGKPIISINDGSTKKVLKNKYNAILIDKEKLGNQLPKEIINLLKNKEQRFFLANNARSFANKELISWPQRMDLEVREVLKILKK
jgi:glycosyltransferase involved in cell wall biosynthesis